MSDPTRAAERAVQFVEDGMAVGLGTGRAAAAFIEALGRRVQAGMRLRGVPTSRASQDQALRLGIPLVTLADVDALDVTVDGADEVDPQLNLIKGRGGALLRERIVAECSRKLVIVVGQEKLVTQLGRDGILPIEVVPFALPLVLRRLAALGCPGVERVKNGERFVTDNGNYILDGQIGLLDRPSEFDAAIREIPGVVGTGLMLGTADVVLVERDGQVDLLERPA